MCRGLPVGLAFIALGCFCCSGESVVVDAAEDSGSVDASDGFTVLGPEWDPGYYGNPDSDNETETSDLPTDGPDPGASDLPNDLIESNSPQDTGDATGSDPGPCVPNCQDKECGPDGCGSTCGTCKETEICSGAQTCDPDPTAGCEGLELAEDWGGTFEGESAFYVLKLIPIDGSTHGDMSFSIKCFNSKLLVSGTMSGIASDNEFNLKLAGNYNPLTKEIEVQIYDGYVFVLNIATGFKFEGDLTGLLGTDGKFTGDWYVSAVEASNVLLGILDPASYSAWAEGEWTAGPAP